MNSDIDAQCRHMIAMVSTFEQACSMAATTDDGHISSDEEKALRKIRASAKRFKDELSKVTK